MTEQRKGRQSSAKSVPFLSFRRTTTADFQSARKKPETFRWVPIEGDGTTYLGGSAFSQTGLLSGFLLHKLQRSLNFRDRLSGGRSDDDDDVVPSAGEASAEVSPSPPGSRGGLDYSEAFGGNRSRRDLYTEEREREGSENTLSIPHLPGTPAAFTESVHASMQKKKSFDLNRSLRKHQTAPAQGLPFQFTRKPSQPLDSPDLTLPLPITLPAGRPPLRTGRSSLAVSIFEDTLTGPKTSPTPRQGNSPPSGGDPQKDKGGFLATSRRFSFNRKYSNASLSASASPSPRPLSLSQRQYTNVLTGSVLHSGIGSRQESDRSLREDPLGIDKGRGGTDREGDSDRKSQRPSPWARSPPRRTTALFTNASCCDTPFYTPNMALVSPRPKGIAMAERSAREPGFLGPAFMQTARLARSQREEGEKGDDNQETLDRDIDEQEEEKATAEKRRGESRKGKSAKKKIKSLRKQPTLQLRLLMWLESSNSHKNTLKKKTRKQPKPKPKASPKVRPTPQSPVSVSPPQDPMSSPGLTHFTPQDGEDPLSGDLLLPPPILSLHKQNAPTIELKALAPPTRPPRLRPLDIRRQEMSSAIRAEFEGEEKELIEGEGGTTGRPLDPPRNQRAPDLSRTTGRKGGPFEASRTKVPPRELPEWAVSSLDLVDHYDGTRKRGPRLMPPDKDPPPPNWRFPTQREFRSAPYLPPPVGQYSPSDAVTTRDCTQGGGVRDFDGVAKRGNLWGSSEEEPIRYALDDRKLHASLGKQILSPKGRGFHDSSARGAFGSAPGSKLCLLQKVNERPHRYSDEIAFEFGVNKKTGEILRVQPPYTERGGARGMIYGKALMKATDIQDRSARAQVENPETLAVGLCKSAGALGELCDEPSAKAQKVKNSLGEWTVKLLDGCIPVLPVEPPREALPSPSFPPHVLAIADLSPKSQQGGNKSHVVLLPPPSPSERRALTASQEERPGSRSERGHGMGGESRGEEQGMPSSGSIVVPSDMEREKCLAADVRGEQEREARLYLKEVEKLRRQILLGRRSRVLELPRPCVVK